MTIYRPRHVTAQLIFDDLRTHGDSSAWQIQQRLGLSGMQFRYGITFIRDELEVKEGQPLIWMPRYGVYSLTTSERDWKDYIADWRLKSIETQLYRTLQTAKAGGMLFGMRKKSIRMIIAGIESAHQIVQATRT